MSQPQRAIGQPGFTLPLADMTQVTPPLGPSERRAGVWELDSRQAPEGAADRGIARPPAADEAEVGRDARLNPPEGDRRPPLANIGPPGWPAGVSDLGRIK